MILFSLVFYELLCYLKLPVFSLSSNYLFLVCNPGLSSYSLLQMRSTSRVGLLKCCCEWLRCAVKVLVANTEAGYVCGHKDSSWQLYMQCLIDIYVWVLGGRNFFGKRNKSFSNVKSKTFIFQQWGQQHFFFGPPPSVVSAPNVKPLLEILEILEIL